MPLRVDQHTWQFEHLGFFVISKACRQVQVSIPSVLHHVSTVEVTMCEPNFVPGFMQVPKHLHKRENSVYLEAVQTVRTKEAWAEVAMHVDVVWILLESMLLVSHQTLLFSFCSHGSVLLAVWFAHALGTMGVCHGPFVFRKSSLDG